MKNEHNLTEKKTLRMVASPFDDDIVITLDVIEKGKEDIRIFSGLADEICGLISFLDNRLEDIKEMDSLYKKGWRK